MEINTKNNNKKNYSYNLADEEESITNGAPDVTSVYIAEQEDVSKDEDKGIRKQTLIEKSIVIKDSVLRYAQLHYYVLTGLYTVSLVICLGHGYFNIVKACGRPEANNRCFEYLIKGLSSLHSQFAKCGVVFFALYWFLKMKIIPKNGLFIVLGSFVLMMFISVELNKRIYTQKRDRMTLFNHELVKAKMILLYAFLLFSIFLILKGSIKCWKSGLIGKFIMIFIIFSIPSYLYFAILRPSCDNWNYGIGGMSLQNEESDGHIIKPTFCELSIRSGLFDLSRWSDTCDKKKMTIDRHTLPEHLRGRNFTTLGYPRVENYENKYRIKEREFAHKVRKDVIDMDDETVPEEIKNNIEFTIDASNPHEHLLNIQVKRNETKAQELKYRREEFISSVKDDPEVNLLDNDVLIIYLDGFSRVNLKRKLPNLYEWLGKFVDSDLPVEAQEFFRYHTVRGNTYLSNYAMYFGAEAHFENDTANVFQHFSDSGYVTGLVRDMGEYEAIHEKGKHQKSLVYKDFFKWDHMATGIACDNNFEQIYGKNLDKLHGRNSKTHHGIYGKELHNIAFEYTMKFWEAYPDVRKLMRYHISDAHENTGDLISYIDDHIVEFLEEFYEKGYLNNTQVMIVSDHGAHFYVRHIPLIPDDSRKVENMFPLLIHLTPKQIGTNSINSDGNKNNCKHNGIEQESFVELTNSEDGKLPLASNLKYNEQRFMSSHDIYATLKSIAIGKSARSPAVSESYSYLYDKLPTGRDGVDTNIKFHKCYCSMDPKIVRELHDNDSYFYTWNHF